MTRAQQVVLWDAINAVVAASGGNPGNTSVARQRAVVAVERAVAGIEATIRHGARAACKRLREERDVTRSSLAWLAAKSGRIEAERDRYRDRLAISPGGDDAIDGLSDAVSQLREAESRLTAERDAARLELRALEWMTFESPRQAFSFGFAGLAPGRVVWVSRPGVWPTEEFATYASAARALGWEG